MAMSVSRPARLLPALLTTLLLAGPLLLSRPALALPLDAETNNAVREAVLQSDSRRLARLSEQIADSYSQAYLLWRQASLIENPDNSKRKQLLAQAEQKLTGQLKQAADDSESMILLGAIYGDQIDGVFSAIRLGKKAERLFKQAAMLDNSNPRLALQRGIGLLFKPASFGGGSERAIAELKRAVSLFQQAENHRRAIRWGATDALIWLGKAYEKQGDTEAALAAWQQALTLSPGHVQLSRQLIPSLALSRENAS